MYYCSWTRSVDWSFWSWLGSLTHYRQLWVVCVALLILLVSAKMYGASSGMSQLCSGCLSSSSRLDHEYFLWWLQVYNRTNRSTQGLLRPRLKWAHYQVSLLLLKALGTFAFVDLMPYKSIKNYILQLPWHKDEYNPDWTNYYMFVILFIFILLLKEIKIKTFLWASKSIVDSQHCDHHT